MERKREKEGLKEGSPFLSPSPFLSYCIALYISISLSVTLSFCIFFFFFPLPSSSLSVSITKRLFPSLSLSYPLFASLPILILFRPLSRSLSIPVQFCLFFSPLHFSLSLSFLPSFLPFLSDQHRRMRMRLFCRGYKTVASEERQNNRVKSKDRD